MKQSASRQQQRAAERKASKKAQRRKLAEVARARPSTPALSARSLSRAARADKIGLLERFDPQAGLRNALREIAGQRGEWAGIPLPLDSHQLIIEPSYPHAKALMSMGAAAKESRREIADEEGMTRRGSFWSWHRRSQVLTWTKPDGRIDWGIVPGVNSLGYALQTLGAADAWGIEQEGAAVQTLGTLVSHRQMKQYLLTGMFLETSKRSGVRYLFRRLRPTVAITTRKEQSRILCTLCLHGIGYYAGSWAGAMCPTDDVVSMLMLMRGDEHMFWRRANQHAAYRPESGL